MIVGCGLRNLAWRVGLTADVECRKHDTHSIDRSVCCIEGVSSHNSSDRQGNKAHPLSDLLVLQRKDLGAIRTSNSSGRKHYAHHNLKFLILR